MVGFAFAAAASASISYAAPAPQVQQITGDQYRLSLAAPVNADPVQIRRQLLEAGGAVCKPRGYIFKGQTNEPQENDKNSVVVTWTIQCADPPPPVAGPAQAHWVGVVLAIDSRTLKIKYSEGASITLDLAPNWVAVDGASTLDRAKIQPGSTVDALAEKQPDGMPRFTRVMIIGNAPKVQP